MKIVTLKSNFVIKRINKHSVLILVVLSLIALIGVFRFGDNSRLQFQILTSLALIYLSWALLHHTIDKSLTLEVVIEYVLTALLAIIILYGTLL